MAVLDKHDLLELARAYDCLEAVDTSVFQRKARIPQSMCRKYRCINGLGRIFHGEDTP